MVKKKTSRHGALPRKVRTFKIRLTDEQKALFSSVAERRGLTLSGWGLMILLQEARKERESELKR